MSLDQQKLGGLMLNLLDQLEQIYGTEGLEEIELEDATIIVSINVQPGDIGRSNVHWGSTCQTFHAQIGLQQLAMDGMRAVAHSGGRPIDPDDPTGG